MALMEPRAGQYLEAGSRVHHLVSPALGPLESVSPKQASEATLWSCKCRRRDIEIFQHPGGHEGSWTDAPEGPGLPDPQQPPRPGGFLPATTAATTQSSTLPGASLGLAKAARAVWLFMAQPRTIQDSAEGQQIHKEPNRLPRARQKPLD